MDDVIRTEHIGKKYVLRHSRRTGPRTLREAFSDRTRSWLRGGGVPAREEFWALQDISISVKVGERLGIIGRNGAGKTTLLKVLSRITEPTAGQALIRGRVASLLEVGTGFHPELTGRENVFLNGAILGMRRHEIRRKFDEIVAFAEVEKFLDTPVKRYSSGMSVRLAFAVAAHLESDILLVDEVLAVGDAQFQKKCMSKMKDVTRAGRTILFVSHNMAAVNSLCSQAVMLEGGRIARRGSAEEVVKHYLESGSSAITAQEWSDPEQAPGNDSIRLRKARIFAAAGSEEPFFTTTTPLALEIGFANAVPDCALNISVVLWKATGECIFNTGSESWELAPGDYSCTCHIPPHLLNEGNYTVEINFVRDRSRVLFNLEDACSFEIHDMEKRAWFGKRMGAVRPKLDFTLKHASPNEVDE